MLASECFETFNFLEKQMFFLKKNWNPVWDRESKVVEVGLANVVALFYIV